MSIPEFEPISLDEPVRTKGIKAPLTYHDKRGKGLDNLFLIIEPVNNEWGIPETQPFTGDLVGIEWISFWDKSKISKNYDDPDIWANVGIHFFIEDFQFKSVWDSPEKWLPLFQKCRAVVTPDFSVYTDMPKAQQLWNHYRRQWCAKYWQDNGVNIISCVTWDLLDPQPWHFYGIPKGTSIARSWVNKNGMKQERLDKFLQLIDELEPCSIYIKCSDTDERELRKHFSFHKIPTVSW